jgi:hypothetical protein
MDRRCPTGAHASSTFQDAYAGANLGSGHALHIGGLRRAVRM